MWAVRLDIEGDELRASERERFEAWLSDNSAHREAFAKARSLMRAAGADIEAHPRAQG